MCSFCNPYSSSDQLCISCFFSFNSKKSNADIISITHKSNVSKSHSQTCIEPWLCKVFIMSYDVILCVINVIRYRYQGMSVLSHLFGRDVKTMCYIVIHIQLRLHGLSMLQSKPNVNIILMSSFRYRAKRKTQNFFILLI